MLLARRCIARALSLTPGPPCSRAHRLREDLYDGSESQGAVFAAVVSLGALVGALTGGWLSDKVGRRMGLALFAIPGIIGWVVIATARPWGGLIPLAVTCAGKTLPLPCVFATAFVGKTASFLAVPRPGALRVLDRRALFANAGAVVLLHPPLTSVDVSNWNGGGGQIGGSNRCQQLQYRARYC